MLASTFPMVLSVSLRLMYNVTRTIIAITPVENDNRESVHVHSRAYKSAPPREHEYQSIFDLRALRGFSDPLSTASRHEVLRYRSVRPGGRRGPHGGETHRSGVRRTGAGRVHLAGSGQEQARVAVKRGLHSAARLQCIHRTGRGILRIQLPLRVHGLFELPLLRRRL